jgi:predicted dehydrogenase
MTARRDFLAGMALTAASYRQVLGANDRVGIGVIGYGLIGTTHVKTFSTVPGSQVVAVADCHEPRAEQGAAAAGGAIAYTDFRIMLENNAVQAVVVATPDHWHALQTMMACAAGKDVYVEKPMTLFVAEGEWIRTVAARTKRVVQVGTQQRSGSHYAKARDLIRAGELGTISSVRMAAIRNVSPGFGSPPDGVPPVGLDYDTWLGPAPKRPFNPNRGLYHFRWFWDYSGGQVTNLGAHHLDIVDWFLGLDKLSQVSSIGGRFALTDNGETPDTQDAIFDCGAYTSALTVREAANGDKPDFGLSFHGTRGSLGIDRKGFTVVPDPDTPPANMVPGVKDGHPAGGPVSVPAAVAKPRTAPRTDTTGDSAKQYAGHATNFLECVRTRQTPISDLASADRVSIACHLANLSQRLKRSLTWDANTRTIRNDREATALLTRPYRAPWDRELTALLSRG